MPRRTRFARLWFIAAVPAAVAAAVAILLPLGASQADPVPPVVKDVYPPLTSGTARVIAHKVQNDANGVEWRWVIVTDRYHCTMAHDSGGNLALEESDSAWRPDGGVVVYDLQIRVEPTKGESKEPRVALTCSVHQRGKTFRGANGTWLSLPDGKDGKGGGEDPLPKPAAPNRVARALFTGDKTLPLPVKLPLFERTVGLPGKEHREVSYLKIDK